MFIPNLLMSGLSAFLTKGEPGAVREGRHFHEACVLQEGCAGHPDVNGERLHLGEERRLLCGPRLPEHFKECSYAVGDATATGRAAVLQGPLELRGLGVRAEAADQHQHAPGPIPLAGTAVSGKLAIMLFEAAVQMGRLACVGLSVAVLRHKDVTDPASRILGRCAALPFSLHQLKRPSSPVGFFVAGSLPGNV